MRTLEIGIGGAGGVENWTVEGLISDGQTEAEIGSEMAFMDQVTAAKGGPHVDYAAIDYYCRLHVKLP